MVWGFRQRPGSVSPPELQEASAHQIDTPGRHEP